MAQTNSGGKKHSTKINVPEIQAKVVAFASQMNTIKNFEEMKGYLNYLCPTIQEKVAFVSMFDKTYPQNKEASMLLSAWLDTEFVRHCNQNVVKQEIESLKDLYQQIYNGGNEKSREQDTQPIEEQPDNVLSETEQKENKGLFGKLFGGLFHKHQKGMVSKLSLEELSIAKSGLLDNGFANSKPIRDYDAEYRLKSYNEKVAKRAEMARLSPEFEKDVSIMSR